MSASLLGRTLLRIALRDGADPKIVADARRLSPDGAVEPIFQKARELVQQEREWLVSSIETISSVSVNPSPDADDVAVWLASHLKAMGYEVRLVFLAQEGRDFLHHVYVEARIEGAWVAFDPHHAGPLGSVYAGRTEIVEAPGPHED